MKKLILRFYLMIIPLLRCPKGSLGSLCFLRRQMNIFYSHTVFPVNHAVCLCGEGDLWCVREAVVVNHWSTYRFIFISITFPANSSHTTARVACITMTKMMFSAERRKNGTRSNTIFWFKAGSSLDSDHYLQ